MEEIKYFIYVRKSSEGKDRQALSHEGQLAEIQKIVNREGLKVAGTYTESKSAHVPGNRPLFDEMLNRIGRGEANGIVAWHTNRLSRNPMEAGIIQQMLQDGKIKSIVVPYRHFRSEDNALLFSIESSEANQYSRDLKVVVKRGLYLKCDKGQPPVLAPPGYSNTKRLEKASNEIVPDPDRWYLMRKAFDLMLSGEYSIAKIAQILNNEHGFRTRSSANRQGVPISVSVLHRAFTNQFYTGYFKYKGKQYPGTYKPMITLEEFDRVQIILGRKEAKKDQRHQFAFTGFMKCGSCGCAITASRKLKKIKTTGEYRTYTFYHCTKRKGKYACTEKHYTKESEIVEMIETELKKLAVAPKYKGWVLEILKESHEEEIEKQKAVLKSTEEYHLKIKRELDTLLDLRIANELNDDKYYQMKSEREALLIRVQEKHQRIKTNVDNWIVHVKDILDSSTNALEAFKTGNTQARKSICQLIGWNWTLQGKKLAFTRHEWFSDIEKIKSFYDDENERLEPIKTFTEYRNLASFNTILPYLSSLRDNSRTVKDEGWENIAARAP